MFVTFDERIDTFHIGFLKILKKKKTLLHASENKLGKYCLYNENLHVARILINLCPSIAIRFMQWQYFHPNISKQLY